MNKGDASGVAAQMHAPRDVIAADQTEEGHERSPEDDDWPWAFIAHKLSGFFAELGLAVHDVGGGIVVRLALYLVEHGVEHRAEQAAYAARCADDRGNGKGGG